MRIGIDKLTPGVFGVSHGSGYSSALIRHATSSPAGHAFLYLGNGQIVEGAPPAARLAPADRYDDAIWAWRMWDQLQAVNGWDEAAVSAAQLSIIGRGHALVDTAYDWPAYAGLALEILNLRSEKQLSAFFRHDSYRVCSALVADAEIFGGIPLEFALDDGPGLDRNPDIKVMLPPNMVTPGMLLGLAQRLGWA